MITMTCEGLGTLRSIESTELEMMLSWRNAPQVRENMYTTHVITIDEHLQWWAGVEKTNKHQYFMYEYQGKPLGIVGFNNIDQRSKNSMWAFYAAPDAPRGTGSRMELLALNHAFENIGLHKLCCEVLAFNAGVLKLHKKFGFEPEGVFRQHYLRSNEFVDVHRLALFSDVWNEKKEAMTERLLAMTGG